MRTGSPLIQVAKSVAAALVVTLGITATSLSGASAAVRPNILRMTLAKSIPPSPKFLVNGVCGTSGPNDTAACTAMVLKTIDNARKSEPLPNVPGSFSVSGFDSLSPGRQLFAIADIERTARGLLPIEGLTLQLHGIALTAARDQNDPSIPLPLRLTGGGLAYYYGSNFAEGTAGPIGANYFWMYDDGLNSPNADCTTNHTQGCWGHRENVLGPYNNVNYCPRGSAVNTVMGAAEVNSGVLYSPSITEIFVNDCGAPPAMYFTWPDVQKIVFGR